MPKNLIVDQFWKMDFSSAATEIRWTSQTVAWWEVSPTQQRIRFRLFRTNFKLPVMAIEIKVQRIWTRAWVQRVWQATQIFLKDTKLKLDSKTNCHLVTMAVCSPLTMLKTSSFLNQEVKTACSRINWISVIVLHPRIFLNFSLIQQRMQLAKIISKSASKTSWISTRSHHRVCNRHTPKD